MNNVERYFCAIASLSTMSDEIKRKVGQVIKQARLSKGLTQNELSGRIGVTRSIITNYEAGGQNLTIDTLQKIADALEVELNITMK